MGNSISLTIKPTDACNMRCKHCYHAVEGFNENVLPMEKVKKFVDLAAKEYSDINILFHGGEPTLAGIEYFREIFNFEKELTNSRNVQFTNTLQTNGLSLERDLLDLFQKNHVNIGVSFDGPNNDILREKTVQVYNSIQYIASHNYRVSILCVETAQTIRYLIDTYKWFKNNKINYKIIPVFSYGNAKKSDEIILDSKLYAEEMVRLYNFWLNDRECDIRVNTLEEFTLLFCPGYTLHFGSSCICHRLAINPDGRIYPCGRPYPEEFFLGNINDAKTISDLFNADGYKKLIDLSARRISKCRMECDYHQICQGGCISNSILDGSFDNINGEACKKSKYLFEYIKPINLKLYEDILNGKGHIYNPRAVKRIEKYGIQYENQNRCARRHL